MTLQTKLDDRRTEFEAGAPPEAVALMHRSTDELRNSGIMDRVLKAGDKAPAFTLPDHHGEAVSSSELLRKGPLVVNFYRGVW